MIVRCRSFTGRLRLNNLNQAHPDKSPRGQTSSPAEPDIERVGLFTQRSNRLGPPLLRHTIPQNYPPIWPCIFRAACLIAKALPSHAHNASFAIDGVGKRLAFDLSLGEWKRCRCLRLWWKHTRKILSILDSLNRKLDKSRALGRIDGAVAIAMALHAMDLKPEAEAWEPWVDAA